jgi:hypothetical protein
LKGIFGPRFPFCKLKIDRTSSAILKTVLGIYKILSIGSENFPNKIEA